MAKSILEFPPTNNIAELLQRETSAKNQKQKVEVDNEKMC